MHVTVNDGPTWPSSHYLGQSGYIEATVTKSEPTIFLALFGYPSVTVLARAVATNEGAGNGCVYTLGTTGTYLGSRQSASTASSCASKSIRLQQRRTGNGSGGSIIIFHRRSRQHRTTGWADFTPKPVGNVIAASDPLSRRSIPTPAVPPAAPAPPARICSTNPIASMPASCSTFSLVKHGTTTCSPL